MKTLKVILGVFAVLAVMVIAAIVFVAGRYGSGTSYPDLTTQPLLPDSALQMVVSSPEPVGNVAVSGEGRIFYTIHPEARPQGPKLYEWVDDAPRPFPAAAVQDTLLNTPQGVIIDWQQRLWLIDHGTHGLKTPQLVALDLQSGEIVHRYLFPDSIAPLGSFLQDLQIDSSGNHIFIADAGFWNQRPALIHYDAGKREARRLLEKHPSVMPQEWIITTPVKEMRFLGGLVNFRVGVDGIAITPDNHLLFYAAMNHDRIYQLPVAAVLLAPERLKHHVQNMGPKPLNDGMSADTLGQIYITDVEHGAVIRRTRSGKLETLVKSDRIRWADALSFGPDGYLYIADSAIPHLILQSREHMREHAPYYVFRFRNDVGGVAGQ